MPTNVGMGVVGGVLMLGAALLLRSHPREMGTTAYGAATASGPANPGGNPAPRVTMGMVRALWKGGQDRRWRGGV